MVNDTRMDEGLLGILGGLLTDDGVAGLSRAALADPTAAPEHWWVEPVDYPFGTPTTRGAVRLRGASLGRGGRRDWSLFVKVVQAYRHWPLIGTVPPEIQRAALTSSMWRYEADVYASGVRDLLPVGLRLPDVHAVVDLGDDRIAVVMEDVAVDGRKWDADRFARAAHLLARMSARLTRLDALPPVAWRVPGVMLDLFYESRLLVAELPALADDRTWAHPLLRAREAGLRGDLAELAGRIPAVLSRLKRLPQLMIHGDASPQNLLVPAARPDTFVAIDWSLGGLAAVGDDLGQLLIGLAHAGELRVAELAALREIVVDAYAAGLGAEGVPRDRDEIRYGLDGGLLLRSAFTALPLDRLHEPLTGELAAFIEARLDLTRYLADLGLALPR